MSVWQHCLTELSDRTGDYICTPWLDLIELTKDSRYLHSVGCVCIV